VSSGSTVTPTPSPRGATGRDDSLGPSDLRTNAWGSGIAAPGSNGSQAAVQTVADGRAEDFGADLQAANNAREGSGCGAATESFDRIGQQAWGSPPGYEAVFNAGQCYRDMGNNDLALERFRSLITVPRYAPLAQEQINRLLASQLKDSQLAGMRASPKPPSKKSATPATAWPQVPAQSGQPSTQQQRAF